MILTCPDCATSYFVADAAIGPTGRKVRCKSCGHVWLAQSEEPLELTPANAAPSVSPPPETSGFGRREETPELEALAAPELPRAYRSRVEQQRRFRRAAAAGAVWAGVAAAFVALVGAAWLFRVDVVDLYPRAATAYAAVGAPVNALGLDIEAQNARMAPGHPETILASGAVRNIRDRSISPPPLRITLFDAEGREIRHRVVPAPARSIRPGAVAGFAALIPDPGGRTAEVTFDFADIEPRQRRPARDTAAPASVPRTPPTAPSPDPSAETALAQAAPARSALRGALDIGPGPSSEGGSPSLAPVDAVPIAGATSEGSTPTGPER